MIPVVTELPTLITNWVQRNTFSRPFPSGFRVVAVAVSLSATFRLTALGALAFRVWRRSDLRQIKSDFRHARRVATPPRTLPPLDRLRDTILRRSYPCVPRRISPFFFCRVVNPSPSAGRVCDLKGSIHLSQVHALHFDIADSVSTPAPRQLPTLS